MLYAELCHLWTLKSMLKLEKKKQKHVMLMSNSIAWLMKLHVYENENFNCSRNETPSNNVLVHWCVEWVFVIMNRESEHVIVNYIGTQP